MMTEAHATLSEHFNELWLTARGGVSAEGLNEKHFKNYMNVKRELDLDFIFDFVGEIKVEFRSKGT